MVESELEKFIQMCKRRITPIILDFVNESVNHEGLRSASTHFLGKGKFMRAALTVVASDVVGGSREAAYRVAAGVEILNVFTLIHDDIIDKDKKRRNLPTVHAKWGIPIALLAGDALHAASILCAGTAYDYIKDEGKMLGILDELESTALVISEGQCHDSDLQNGEVSPNEENYFRMVRCKTAHLFGAAAQVGAMLAGADAVIPEKFATFGRLVGTGFQVTDDILGIIADESKLGKPVGSDVREGKMSLPILHFLAHATQAQKNSFDSYFKKRVNKTKMKEVRELFKETGSIDYAVAVANKYADDARRELDSMSLAATHRQLLNEYAQRAVQRSY